MPLTVTSWNINSIRARTHLVHDWLERHPDCALLGLQEIKCESGQFPSSFKEAGFHVAVCGQKSYNGVAFISRKPLNITSTHLPGFEDPSARYIETEIEGITIGNLYLPNGNSGGETGFAKKLNFLDALYQRARNFLSKNQSFIFMGDYNVCPTNEDYTPKALAADDALIRPESRAAFQRLIWAGLTDALRALYPAGRYYTFYDYQARAFQRNSGLRIDHALLSPSVTDRLSNFVIERDERAKEKPSDHVPIVISLT